MTRTVHLVCDDSWSIGAIKAGLNADDVLTVAARAGAVRVRDLAGIDYLALDLGVIDGHDIGYHLIRASLFTHPGVIVAVITNAPVPEVLPPALRGDRVHVLGKPMGTVELARQWHRLLRRTAWNAAHPIPGR